MIVLDARVVIAARSSDDVHRDAARDILGTPAGQLVIHPVTLAEVLVDPARRGLEHEVASLLTAELSISVFAPDDAESVRVAGLRARTRMKLPDCYVLSAATVMRAAVASFDGALTAAAASVGLNVLGG